MHFAHIEYMYMNELTLIDRFARTMEAQTQSGCIDRNGTHLVDFTACARQTGGMGEGEGSVFHLVTQYFCPI